MTSVQSFAVITIFVLAVFWAVIVPEHWIMKGFALVCVLVASLIALFAMTPPIR